MKRLFLTGFSLIFLFFIATSILLLIREMPPPNKEFENHPGEEELTSRAETAFAIASARGDKVGQAINHPRVTIARMFVSRYLEGYRLDPLFFPHPHSAFPLPGIGVIPFIILPFFVLGFFFLPRLENHLKAIMLALVVSAPILGMTAPWSNLALIPILFMIYASAFIGCWYVVNDKLRGRPSLQAGVFLPFLLNAIYIIHQWVSHQ